MQEINRDVQHILDEWEKTNDDSSSSETSSTTSLSTEVEQPIEAEIVHIEDLRSPFLRGRTPLYFFISSVFLFVFAFTILFSTFVSSSFNRSATVTIIPTSTNLSTVTTLHIPARIFAPLTMAQTKTVSTTGIGHQDPIQAQGIITFYNASQTMQVIDAGTLLTASSGQQFITDQTAYIPSSIPPLEGQFSVSAHALVSGVQGNIPVGAIHGACCKVYVFGQNNSNFTGGIDARNFHTVTKSDVALVTSQLQTALHDSLLQSFQKQLDPSESLLSPVCTSKIQIDHKIGEEALQVKIDVSEACQSAGYNPQVLQNMATLAVMQTAGNSGYHIAGLVKTDIQSIALENDFLEVKVALTARLVRTFAKEQLHVFQVMLSGKKKEDVYLLLFQTQQVASVTITSSQDRLPSDPSQITLKIAQ